MKCERLIKSGIPVDATDSEGVTALSWAVFYCKIDVVRKLIELGADVNHADVRGGLIRYFDRKIGQGNEPLAQIRRRILVARDLNDLRNAKGEIFSGEELRKLLSPGPYRLDAPAIRYMVQLANLRNEGGLGLVKNPYATAATLAGSANAEVITVDMLRKAHGFQVSLRTRGMVENKLAQEARAVEQQEDQPRRVAV